MEFELLNELVENGYDGEDLDELFEFAIDYILEYEELVEAKDPRDEEDDKELDDHLKNQKLHKATKVGAKVGGVTAGGLAGGFAGGVHGTIKGSGGYKKNFNRTYAKQEAQRRGRIRQAMNIDRMLHKAAGKAAVSKKAKRYSKIGAVTGAGLTAAGLGGKALYNKMNKKKEND